MNWRQLYTATTPQERIELIEEMFRTIEVRHRRWILARGRLIRDRWRQQPWHFIGERRTLEQRRRRAVYLAAFAVILSVLSLDVWLVAMNIPSPHAALLVLLYDIALLSILFFKPYRFRNCEEISDYGWILRM